MLILWIDTVSKGCHVAIGDEFGIKAICSLDTERAQSEHIIPLIDKAIKQAQISLNDIERISVCCGPGSFTAVRVGLAVGRMLAQILNIPCIGFSQFDMALTVIEAPKDNIYGIAIPSYNEVPYIQIFNNGKSLSQPTVTDKSLLKAENVAILYIKQSISYFDDISLKKEFFYIDDSPALIHQVILKNIDITNLLEYPATPLYIQPIAVISKN
ncbi:MAG: tRNA (adenosine(37)-N6)-threonylcarbamoyltransferase complex dimerization subunit type 1 TsaB [Alphaproteobacteria bacterium]